MKKNAIFKLFCSRRTRTKEMIGHDEYFREQNVIKRPTHVRIGSMHHNLRMQQGSVECNKMQFVFRVEKSSVKRDAKPNHLENG